MKTNGLLGSAESRPGAGVSKDLAGKGRAGSAEPCPPRAGAEPGACQRIWRRAQSFAGRRPFEYSSRAMAEERSIWREYLEALIIAAVFLLFTNTFVVQTFYIPSGCM